MSPGHKRQIAEEFVSGGRCTGRAACRHFGLHRSTFAYRAKQPNAWLSKLKSAVRRVSNQYPEMGYPKIARLLKREGWSVGARMVQRVRRELGLAVPAKKPRRRRRGPSTGLPTKARHRNHVWTWDFVHDTTMRGGKLPMLNVIDEYTRECLCIHVDRRINARFREECLDREQLWTLTEARVVIEDWRWKYNNIRPHRSLGYVTPLEFVQEQSKETESNQCWASSRPTASLRPNIDILYNINHIINTSRLTKAMAQFG